MTTTTMKAPPRPADLQALMQSLASRPSKPGYRVLILLKNLGVLIRVHRMDDGVSRALARMPRAKLVVINDIAVLPGATDTAEGL